MASALRGIGTWVQLVDTPQTNEIRSTKISSKELEAECPEVSKQNGNDRDLRIRAWVSNFDLDFWHGPKNVPNDRLDHSLFRNQVLSYVIPEASPPSENDMQPTQLSSKSKLRPQYSDLQKVPVDGSNRRY
ncbi:hypothetical protein Daesc_009262 [Daldinia eschscholtzii]|uniref:Uncharacterized protein n=1 Tax=Daldinia eschscholtzii TaxID=292717 RepID=A0AAX6M933_9PEZI